MTDLRGAPAQDFQSELERFDAELPVEEASTPPKSWYLDPRCDQLERELVFARNWLPVALNLGLAAPGSYVAGCVAGRPYFVIRQEDGTLRAFHNACRHHAAELVADQGRVDELVCPYHGWTYALDGGLKRAPHVAGIQNFRKEDFGLKQIPLTEWGPYVWICFDDNPRDLQADLGELATTLERTDWSDLRFVRRQIYELKCNWKVFVDNYLDGGYHVAAVHGGLSSQLQLDTYHTETAERFSLQTCQSAGSEAPPSAGDFSERLAGGALYGYVYPNLMINRYGPILDNNIVEPLGPDRCRVIFDYFFAEDSRDSDFVERSVAASHQVQLEDVAVCESVQRGLGSPAYDVGRYAPRVEHAMYHFHRLLAQDLRRSD